MRPVIVTHCGAGSDKKLQGLAEESAAAGFKILKRGGSALDAVQEATIVLEDDPRTNAGIGSRRRTDGTVQLDAALMDSDKNIGAVAAIMNVRNPIIVARMVMDTPHVLLVGDWATDFARRRGIPFFDPTTELSWAKWRDSMDKMRKGDMPEWAGKWREYRFKDTVGAVARDSKGRFATANSTAGTSFMLPGRVGDSPIIGAGLYAGPLGAVTATGIGEEIIRHVSSKAVYDLIQAGRTPMQACGESMRPFPDSIPVGILAVSRDGWGEACNRDMAWAVRPKR